MTPNEKKVQYVVWDDSYRALRDWTHFDDFEPTDGHCVSVGFLLNEDDKWLTLVSNLDVRSKPEYGLMAIQIPKKAICSWWELSI